MVFPVATYTYLKEQFDWHQKRTLGYFEKVWWKLGFCASKSDKIKNSLEHSANKSII
jgi:hypothetical protein